MTDLVKLVLSLFCLESFKGFPLLKWPSRVSAVWHCPSLASSCSILHKAVKVPYPGQVLHPGLCIYSSFYLSSPIHSSTLCFSLKVSSSEKPLLILKSNQSTPSSFTICFTCLACNYYNSWLWYLETVPWRQVFGLFCWLLDSQHLA